MLDAKRKRLESRGWKIGTVREYLELTDQEEAYVELRLKLADALKRQGIRRNLTQADLAKTINPASRVWQKWKRAMLPSLSTSSSAHFSRSALPARNSRRSSPGPQIDKKAA